MRASANSTSPAPLPKKALVWLSATFPASTYLEQTTWNYTFGSFLGNSCGGRRVKRALHCTHVSATEQSNRYSVLESENTWKMPTVRKEFEALIGTAPTSLAWEQAAWSQELGRSSEIYCCEKRVAKLGTALMSLAWEQTAWK